MYKMFLKFGGKPLTFYLKNAIILGVILFIFK